MKVTEDAMDHIASIENETRKSDALKLIGLMKELTGLEPLKWGPSIIGFGRYTYKYDTGRETELPLVSFSPRKPHQVLYVLNGFKGQGTLLGQLGKHKTGNVCLYVNKLEDVNIEVLEKIIRESYSKNKAYSEKD